MTAYYNEIDPFAAKWLRQLISKNLIPNGVVDTRSITEIDYTDLSDFTQLHFFAGIGGWAYALRLAGWPEDRPVWTGSCPCQPFSIAGRRAGTDDSRHLWPVWFNLIRQSRPPVVFGEQVASQQGLGWLSSVQADLEEAGYASGSADLSAAGIGAPHIRQRLYFVGVADTTSEQWNERLQSLPPGSAERIGSDSESSNGVANAISDRLERRVRRRSDSEREALDRQAGSSGPANFWSNADWLYFQDERWRPVEPESFPLANGIPNRVGRLRGYGNAIVPQVAAEFVKAFI